MAAIKDPTEQKVQRISGEMDLVTIGNLTSALAIHGFGRRRGGADLGHVRRARHEVHFRRAFRVGTWNILSVSDDKRVHYLSDELGRLSGYSGTLRAEEAGS